MKRLLTVNNINDDAYRAFWVCPFIGEFLKHLTSFHTANYGANAEEFFEDALDALDAKLTAAGGTVQVGVLKDVSLVNTQSIHRGVDSRILTVQQHQGDLQHKPIGKSTSLGDESCPTRHNLDVPVESELSHNSLTLDLVSVAYYAYQVVLYINECELSTVVRLEKRLRWEVALVVRNFCARESHDGVWWAPCADVFHSSNEKDTGGGTHNRRRGSVVRQAKKQAKGDSHAALA